jgi:hypothetical protein
LDLLQKALELHYQEYPEDKEIHTWAGCNYYINRGNHVCEPVGTATSMHDCGSCEKLNYCKLIKPTPIWEWSEGIEKQMNEQWKSMMN